MPDATAPFDPELWQQLVAERAIQRVILEYARGVDERDFARIRACFHEDARITYGERPAQSLDEAIAWLEQVVPAMHSLSHYFGHPIVDLGPGGAWARCQTWCINMVEYPRDDAGEGPQEVLGLLYDDRFEYRQGAWRIAERRNRDEWRLRARSGEAPPVPGEESVS